MKKYDVAIIGSSPICIAEAIYQVSQGKSVCVIEKGPLGGSWKVENALGIPFLEVGPHVFNGPKRGYKCLKKFGLNPIQSHLWYFDTNNNKLYTKNLFATKSYEKALYWFDRLFEGKINFIKLFYNIFKFLQHSINIKREVVCYLKGGTYELMDTLLKNKHWQKVDLITKRCENIEPNPTPQVSTEHCHGIRMMLENGGNVIVSEVVMTSCSDLDISKIYQNFSSNKNLINFKQKSFKSCQIVMLIEKNKPKLSFTSFISSNSNYIGNENFLSKKKIKYINDITSYVSIANNINLEKNGSSLITLSVDPDEYQKAIGAGIDIDKILQDLKRLKLINEEACVLDLHEELFFGRAIGSLDIDIFNEKIESNIKIIKSENLLVAFAENFIRWKKIG